MLARLRERLRRVPPPTPAPAPKPRVQGTNFHGFDAAVLDHAMARLRRFPPYSDADYRELHPDVAASDFDPAFHALGFGAFEARRFFTPASITRSLDRIVPTPPPQTAAVSIAAGAMAAVSIHVSSAGNAFMADIARDLAADLSDSGLRVSLLDETAAPGAADGIRIFVAPHEFFRLGAGRAWMREDVITAAVMLNTEQVQTPWFAQSLPFLFMARGAIDLSIRTAGLLREAGLPAIDHLPAAHRPHPPLTSADRAHPLFRDLPPAAQTPADPRLPFADRPIDIAFLGTAGPRRAEFFAATVSAFATYRSVIVLRDPGIGPIAQQGDDAALTRLAAHISAHAKISLNIHQDDFRTFEWHRIVRLGMGSGSLVVSEPCEPQRAFQPGTDYLEAEAARIPALLDWLLRTPDGHAEAERIRANATILLSDETARRRDAARLCAFLHDPALGTRDDPV